MWASSVLKHYRRIFGSGAASDQLQSGVETVLDGNAACAVTEACIAEAAGLGGSFPADDAERVWNTQKVREHTNFFGRTLASVAVGDARGALASALGLSASGLRATAFLSGPDLVQCQDLVRTAVGRHLPLVIHMDARAPGGHASARGSGHEAYHAAADWGCFQLFARNVQQAVDFTVAARHAAELGLVPALVAVDAEQTALAVQDVHLPPPELVRDYLGSPDAAIETPSEAQKLLFGDRRRRIPKAHDLDRPVLSGGFAGTEAWALGAVGQRPYFSDHLSVFLERAASELAVRTGRALPLVSSYETEDAHWILIAQGSAIETAEAMVGWLRKERKQKIGVVGLHCLRPFPAARVLELIGGKRGVAVLERLEAPWSSDAPLLREIRAATDRALENGRFGSETHPGLPSWSPNQRPRLHSVLYGMGGRPLRGSDLAALASELESKGRSQVYLGIPFAPESSSYPKREVLLNQLRRSYPQLSELSLCAQEASSPEILPEGALTVAVHRLSGSGEGLAAEAAALVHRLAGGSIRSRSAASWDRFAAHVVDRFTHAATPLRDPGDDVREDIAVIAAPAGRGLTHPLANLRKGGTVIVLGEGWAQLHAEAARLDAKVLAVPHTEEETARREHLLGGLAAVVASRLGLKPKKCSAARSEMLEHLTEEEGDVHRSAFETGFTQIQEVPGPFASSAAAAHVEPDVPMAVRVLGGTDGTWESLPRFWDQVGVLYRDGASQELSADPYLATGALPPLTSTFRDFTPARETLPVFDPTRCTGCGACWTWCPDGAVAPLVAGPAALLEAGVGLTKADSLRPLVSQLANRVTTEIKKADPAPRRFGEVLEPAFAWLGEKMPMPEERKQAVQSAFNGVLEQLGSLPIAVTKAFFDDAETRAKNSGELLSIAISADGCKGCGLCAEVCEPAAIVNEPQDAALVQETRRQWRLWEQLPDTAGETIDRAREHADVGPAAAMLLSRSCLLAMASGDGAEAGSGDKITVRWMLAAAEYQQQPRVRRLAEELDATREKLATRIRETLARALPTSDLDALAEGLDGLGTSSMNLAALMERIHGAIEQGLVDTTRLRREVETAQYLADAHWRLTQAVGGMGRSRVGLAFAADASTSWMGTFPDNPFSAPAFVDSSGDPSGLAKGLIEGQLAAAMDTLLALRRAKLELENPDEAERQTALVGELTWRDLSSEEREACPPLILVGSVDALTRNGSESLLELLRSDMPIKVLALSDNGTRDSVYDFAFTAMALRKAFVAQTSISEPKHFHESVRAAFAYPGPALLHVYGPSPRRHGFPQHHTVELARLAVASRSFPLFRYNPSGEGVFGLRLSLDGNPEAENEYVKDAALGEITPAHWAIRQKRFTGFTEPWMEGAPAPTGVVDFIRLPHDQRTGKTPFVTVDAEGARVAVAPELVAACEERMAVWRALQELSGLVTPFTQRVREEAEKATAEEHQDEIRALRNEYEEKIKALGAAKETEIAQRIREQLLVLTGYKGAGKR